MNINETIEILEALASGYSPVTGEILDQESVMNERKVIRALQIAIDNLRKDPAVPIHPEIEIADEEIKRVVKIFKEQEKKATPNQLATFFLGTRKFKNELIISHELYGKYRDSYLKGQLLDFFSQYPNDYDQAGKKAYTEIDFFDKEAFNNLSEKSIHQLKEKINEIGVLKMENLSDSVRNMRKYHPRAYESWSETEKELLSKALQYTNDLQLLSDCFQRGESSMKSAGQRLIYQSQISQTDGNAS